jgi:YVTN family beta-propeller protein
VLGLLAVVVAAASGQWLETTIPVPDTFGGIAMPNQLAYDSAGNHVYVAGTVTRNIFVLDATNGRRLARIPFEGDIRALCYSSASNKMYAAAFDRDLVAVIDAGAMQVVDTIPTGDAPVALAYNPTLDRIYCVNLFGRTVSVIDCEDDSVLATVAVGQQPFSVCWNPTRNVVYCANSGSNTVSVIDAANDTVVGTIPTGSAPLGFVYNPDLNKLYTANYGSGTVTVIDGLSDSVLANIGNGESPCRLCYNPVNNKVFVADEDGAMMVIDCVSDTLLGEGEAYGSLDVAYDQLNNHVYATDGGYVVVIDGATGEYLTDVRIGYYVSALCVADSARRVFGAADDDALVGVIDCTADSLLALAATDPLVQPTAVCFNPTTDRAYCAVAGANAVMILDGVDNSTRQVVPSGVQPGALIHDPLGNKVYCANAGVSDMQATITVIDGAGDSVLRTIETRPMGGYWYYPQQLCLNPAGDRLYEALYRDNSVLVVDAVADSIVCEVPLGEPPRSLCYGPAHDYVYVGVSSAVDVIDAELNLMIAHVDVGSNPVALCYVPVGAKVYTADYSGRTVSVVAGERPELVAQVDVVGRPNALCWDSQDNKVYCACRDSDRVAVIDAHADTVVALVQVGDEPWTLSYDSLNNCVYCACRYDNNVAVIDCEKDSVVTVVAVDSEPVAMAWNPIDFRLYVANREGYSASVIRDSLRVGVAEGGVMNKRNVTPALVRGVLPLAGKSRAALLDIAGRKAADLVPGKNDIRHLAPGVYFICEEPQASSPKPKAIRKVVIAR